MERLQQKSRTTTEASAQLQASGCKNTQINAP